jgi:hypothetical protein
MNHTNNQYEDKDSAMSVEPKLYPHPQQYFQAMTMAYLCSGINNTILTPFQHIQEYPFFLHIESSHSEKATW